MTLAAGIWQVMGPGVVGQREINHTDIFQLHLNVPQFILSKENDPPPPHNLMRFSTGRGKGSGPRTSQTLRESRSREHEACSEENGLWGLGDE